MAPVISVQYFSTSLYYNSLVPRLSAHAKEPGNETSIIYLYMFNCWSLPFHNLVAIIPEELSRSSLVHTCNSASHTFMCNLNHSNISYYQSSLKWPFLSLQRECLNGKIPANGTSYGQSVQLLMLKLIMWLFPLLVVHCTLLFNPLNKNSTEWRDLQGLKLHVGFQHLYTFVQVKFWHANLNGVCTRQASMHWSNKILNRVTLYVKHI